MDKDINRINRYLAKVNWVRLRRTLATIEYLVNDRKDQVTLFSLDGIDYKIPKHIPFSITRNYAINIEDFDFDEAVLRAARSLLGRRALEKLNNEEKVEVLNIIEILMNHPLFLQKDKG